MEFLGFVPEPNCGRGTLGIIWNCLSTIFLSVWVSCHPPTLKPLSTKSWLYKRKLTTSALSLILPEVAAIMAMDALFCSIQLRREILQIPRWDTFSLKQAFLVDGLKSLYQKESSSSIRAKHFVVFARSGRLNPSDFPSDDEIDDRSKSSGVLKAISISQTLWFMVNMAWRLNSGYQISPLEDLTVAHAFCGFIMFLCWFHSPQDIHQPFYVPIREESSSMPDSHGNKKKTTYGMRNLTGSILIMVLFVIFTGIHVAAWNYPFATVTKTWVWRVSSIMIFVLGVPGFNFSGFGEDIEKRTGIDVETSGLIMLFSTSLSE